MMNSQMEQLAMKSQSFDTLSEFGDPTSSNFSISKKKYKQWSKDEEKAIANMMTV